MGWKDRIKSIQTKVREVKIKANRVVGTQKAKATKARAKSEAIKAQKIVHDLSNAENRLKELRSADAIEKKRQEIKRLESRLTTKGKLLTMLDKGLSTAMKEAKKGMKQTGETRVRHKKRTKAKRRK